MQSRPRPAAAQTNRQTYIPPAVQQAMNQQLQRTAPAHLKKYVGTGAYVPQHAQQALQQHLQQTSPGHLKQYAGAFVQQNVIQPGLHGPAPGSTVAPSFERAPAPNQLRRDHSNVSAAQYSVEVDNSPPDNPPIVREQPQISNPGAQPQPGGAYDFILNPEQKTKKGFSLPGGKLIKAACIVIALLVLLILFSLIKGLFSSDKDLAPYINVAQDQQALIALAKTGSSQRDLSTVNKNYAYTAQLSLASAQTDLLAYLKNQHYKVDEKRLGLKVSAAADRQLTDALAAGTYNQTYQDLAEGRLKTYLADLDNAYKASSGPKGRALLKDHYAQAQLLLKQLSGPAT